MNNKSYRSALLSSKCPSCREGDLFKHPLSRVRHFAEMHPQCPVCGVGFEPEPGFYFGSMFITYAFNVVIFVVAGVTLYYYLNLPEAVYLTLIVLMAVISLPFSFRMSRTLWLYWFGGLRYKGNNKS